jgi:hypothetical protein
LICRRCKLAISQFPVRVGDIPVLPKYQNKDFQKTGYWRLRGGLDVPKERFVSFPHGSRDADGSLAIAWAGWNSLQIALAIASHYQDLKEPDASHGERMGDYLHHFVEEEAKALGLTHVAFSTW